MKNEKKIKINYISYIKNHYTPSTRNMKKWILMGLLKDITLEVNIIFVGNQRMRTLNRKFLNKDKPTNVLTFTYKDYETISGDIILCPEVINKEAKSFGFSNDSRWAHMVVHSMLHLQGYDHHSRENQESMENMEIKLLSNMKYNNPYVRS
tara:strand:+ start:4414 stop:4866 length:453 start_codon:yes stop_codon:yes gene_type:complete